MLKDEFMFELGGKIREAYLHLIGSPHLYKCTRSEDSDECIISWYEDNELQTTEYTRKEVIENIKNRDWIIVD